MADPILLTRRTGGTVIPVIVERLDPEPHAAAARALLTATGDRTVVHIPTLEEERRQAIREGRCPRCLDSGEVQWIPSRNGTPAGLDPQCVETARCPCLDREHPNDRPGREWDEREIAERDLIQEAQEWS